jgi:hypothetical protein
MSSGGAQGEGSANVCYSLIAVHATRGRNHKGHMYNKSRLTHVCVVWEARKLAQHRANTRLQASTLAHWKRGWVGNHCAASLGSKTKGTGARRETGERKRKGKGSPQHQLWAQGWRVAQATAPLTRGGGRPGCFCQAHGPRQGFGLGLGARRCAQAAALVRATYGRHHATSDHVIAHHIKPRWDKAPHAPCGSTSPCWAARARAGRAYRNGAVRCAVCCGCLLAAPRLPVTAAAAAPAAPPAGRPEAFAAAAGQGWSPPQHPAEAANGR